MKITGHRTKLKQELLINYNLFPVINKLIYLPGSGDIDILETAPQILFSTVHVHSLNWYLLFNVDSLKIRTNRT